MATNGADVIAYKDNVKYVIQVKFYNNPVGNKAVQEVVGAIGMYNADKGVVVTNSTFTPSAVELANANNIELVNGEKIEIYKKKIVNNVESKSSNYDEEFIKNVIQLWNIATEDVQIDGNPKCLEELFFKFGMVLRTMDNENFYKEYNINKFLELLYKCSYLDEKLDTVLNMGYNDVIELYIKAGIFQAFLMSEFDKSSGINDTNVTDVDKIMIIYINNVDELGTKEQVLALSVTFGWDTEETINAIQEYKEKLSN